MVAHLGTGVSLAALREGRMVDVVNPQDEGPFAGDRAGGVPVTAVVDLCFAPGAEQGAVRRRLFGDGGLCALLGTRDAREAVARAAAGDAAAVLVVEAMAYQVAKSIGAMAVALDGRVDAVILTGGMAWQEGVVGAHPPPGGVDRAGGDAARRGRARGACGRGAAGALRGGGGARLRAAPVRTLSGRPCYTRPWETMALATRMKPAMLAPTT